MKRRTDCAFFAILMLIAALLLCACTGAQTEQTTEVSDETFAHVETVKVSDGSIGPVEPVGAVPEALAAVVETNAFRDIPSTDYYCVDGFVKMKDIRDNKYYKVTSVNSKTWLAENLNYADSVSTVSLKGRSFCYNNKVDSCAKYGRLYTWSAVMDSATTGCGYGRTCPVNNSLPVQGICPDGWYVPSHQADQPKSSQ